MAIIDSLCPIYHTLSMINTEKTILKYYCVPVCIIMETRKINKHFERKFMCMLKMLFICHNQYDSKRKVWRSQLHGSL